MKTIEEIRRNRQFLFDKASSEEVKKLTKYKIYDSEEISVKLFNCLHSANIHYFEQLTEYTEKELLLIRHFGKFSLNELKILLSKYNLKLKEN